MPGFVGVPAIVADQRRRPVDGIAVLVEIGDHMGDVTALAARLPRRLDLAEIAREVVLLLAGQRLAGEHDHMVIAKRCENPLLRRTAVAPTCLSGRDHTTRPLQHTPSYRLHHTSTRTDSGKPHTPYSF